jgi:riboflavin synthase
MFTGIIEATGVVTDIKKESANLRLSISCPFINELKVDQSVSHNGVCLTVEKISGNSYEVVAVEETLKRSNLGKLNPGDLINLERSMKLGDRLDGHIVQGHVDETAVCNSVENRDGSWLYSFKLNAGSNNILIEKGSVSVNGVSLTVVDTAQNNFSVAIIPYTFEHTNFKTMKAGDTVNIEFDVIGKYVQKIMENR